ncbi:pyridoxal kinase PdxY [Endozoicomonas sp. SCSIO W0465]|uniref:pyridoxal kinase PdxY n=1 Tax=Endozoicomonas sp. SCSIO W0465 TaxID=2918516 RepID=UPI0020761EC1|nr:pyridoxal kinase PdxY [Endozoicomonas sp. SCSIO W0465]USE36361.1 pyridoxal kinase PdxY [Endozoicomonas sp. SCSIO W0465]
MRGVISIQSHVVFGHAGNSSAVFPLQRMGFEVFPVNTVQFSNHTQYSQGWKGRAFPATDLTEITDGLATIGVLDQCDAILTGYQGNADQCDAVADIVNRVKEHNPSAIYVCDPVMGAPDKGCIVGEGIAQKLIHSLMPMADVIVPNQFELSQFAAMEINNVSDAVLACKRALNKGPGIVLVKHLYAIADDKFSMMLAFDDQVYMVQRPKPDFEKPLVGVGDLISSLFTAGLLKGWSIEKAFKHCNEAAYAVVKETQRTGEWELQIIAAQDELVNPSERFALYKYIDAISDFVRVDVGPSLRGIA